MSILILRSAAAVEEPPGDGPEFDIFFDDFEDRTRDLTFTGLTSEWTSLGYADGEFNDMSVLQRSDMPAELLAVIPASKTRVIRCGIPSNEAQSRAMWADFPPGVRDVTVEWIEWRPNSNMAGEKFTRLGNFIGENRGHDIIVTLSNAEDAVGVTLLDNSDAGQYPWGEGFSVGLFSGWPGGLAHFAVRTLLSTGTNADGQCQVYHNGNLHANWTGVRMHQDATAAARNIQLAELGGWSSGTGPGTAYPIDRYILAWGITSTRNALWSLDDI
jgi:hypothetical protein